jgi:hypothetical protein
MGARLVNYTELKRRFISAENDVRRGKAGRNQEIVALTGALMEGEIKPHEFSLAALFDTFVEDGRTVRESFNPHYQGHGVPLLEAPDAVSTSHFSNITGQLVFATVLEAWNNPMLIGNDLCTTIRTQFDGEKLPGIGGIGDQAEAIGEAQQYPLAGLSEEWIETPPTIKRGMIVPVTKEAIFFDRTGLVLDRASEVGTFIAINKEKRILDMALGLTTSYRRNGGAAQATYGDTHTQGDFDNVAASNALVDYTDIENALLLFDGMTDPNTGEPIIVNPNTIVVPTALSMTLDRIVNSTAVQVGSTTSATVPVHQSPNPLRGRFNVKSNAYVKARTSSASTWFIGDFKKAFAYMENWPATVTQAPQNSHDEFHRDIAAQYKVSERGAAAVREPRAVVKSTA